MKTISECCQKESNFIHSYQPVLESIFRLFLSNNNNPLSAEDIIEKLDKRRGGSPVSLSVETLQRLLDKKRVLGLGPVPTEEPADDKS